MEDRPSAASLLRARRILCREVATTCLMRVEELFPEFSPLRRAGEPDVYFFLDLQKGESAVRARSRMRYWLAHVETRMSTQ